MTAVPDPAIVVVEVVTAIRDRDPETGNETGNAAAEAGAATERGAEAAIGNEAGLRKGDAGPDPGKRL